MLLIEKEGELLPCDAEAIISLCEKIIEHHKNLGPSSPLGMSVIASLSTRTSGAKEKHNEGMKYKKLMESAWRERDHYLLNSDRDIMSDLKAIYATLKEQEIDLSGWGFQEDKCD